MRVSMPRGRAHGWGIAGEYLTTKIAKLPYIEGVTLHCISGHDFHPMEPADWNNINIGYCFFENDIEALRHTRRAAQDWEFIVAGSSWCEYQLRIGGVCQTSTILQGIDPTNFYPLPQRPDDGRFIVFSGGKFEYRKGQDLVIAAMRVFMQRHNDVYLACSWINQWPFSLATMAQSPHIVFHPSNDDCQTILQRTLHENGIPPERVYLAPLVDNALIRQIYQQADIGIFPNRCEGGNNMIMCEYMACGRTVIASDATGHADVITAKNAFSLSSYFPVLIKDTADQPTAIWHEGSVEEIIEQLEFAYRNRDLCVQKGAIAAEDMKQLSWDKAAREFHAIGMKLASSVASVPAGQSSKQIQDLKSKTKNCRICNSVAGLFFEGLRPFYICSNCGFIFTECRISSEEVVKHYQNQYANAFDWSSYATSLLKAVSNTVHPRKILDFGSGSGLLAGALRSLGLEVDVYEPMSHGDFRVGDYNNNYDLVILNEVIEHIEDVLPVFDDLCTVLRPGGAVFISTLMTDTIINAGERSWDLFRCWWYKDDPTHVSFYCQLTFEYLCEIKGKMHLKLLNLGSNGAVLQKNS